MFVFANVYHSGSVLLSTASTLPMVLLCDVPYSSCGERGMPRASLANAARTPHCVAIVAEVVKRGFGKEIQISLFCLADTIARAICAKQGNIKG